MNEIEGSKLSVAAAKREFGELCSMTFESLFRKAQKKDVKPGVDEQATFILLNDCLWDKLPYWSWPLLCGVLKHAMCA